jgi:hypothetical protein
MDEALKNALWNVLYIAFLNFQVCASRDSVEHVVKRTLLQLIVATILILAFVWYRTRPRTHFNVTPDAQREIEKAKRR